MVPSPWSGRARFRNDVDRDRLDEGIQLLAAHEVEAGDGISRDLRQEMNAAKVDLHDDVLERWIGVQRRYPACQDVVETEAPRLARRQDDIARSDS